MKKTILQNRILSNNNRFLSFSFLGIILADLLAFILLLVTGISFKYCAIPLVLFLCEVAFSLVYLISNPRFKYSIIQHVGVELVLFLFLLLSSVFFFFDFQATSMTIAAWVFLIATHLIFAFSIFRLALLARNDKRHTDKKQIFSLLGLSIVSSLVYLVFIISSGYFGQGNTGRALVYSYDTTTDTYIVSDVLNGKGRVINVPETYNGKFVSKFNLNICNDEALAKINIEERSYNLTFVNSASIVENKTYDIEFVADYSNIDSLKTQLYDFAKIVSGTYRETFIGLANNFSPAKVDNDNVVLTFNYDLKGFNNINGEYIPTQLIKKGDSFDFSSLNISYLKHYNQNSDEDLYWNFKNNGLIFKGFVDEKNIPFDTSKVTSNAKIYVSFDKITQLYFLDGNDTMYSGIDNEKYTSSLDCKLVTESTVQKALDNYSRRDGFDLTFKENSADGRTIDKSNIVDFIRDKSAVNIYPFWELNAPDSSWADSNDIEVTYGDNFSLSVINNQHKLGAVTYSYQWTYRSSDSSDNASEMEFSNIYPSDPKSVFVKVTVSCPSKTSLTASVILTKNVKVNAKGISLNWNDPSNLIYDATNKVVKVYPNNGDIINGDSLSLAFTSANSLTHNSDNSFDLTIKDAHSYDFKASVDSSSSAKYKIVSGATHSVTISPRDVYVQINDASKTYDGQTYTSFSYVVDNFVDASFESTFGISYDSIAKEAKNVGTYTINATYIVKTNSIAKNYKVTIYPGELTINKRSANLVWDSTNTFVYNGQNQHRMVAAIDNVVSGEENSLLNKITYSGDQKNVGTYQAIADVSGLSNYIIDSSSLSSSYSITQKSLSITCKPVSKTYDGTCYGFSQNDLNISGLVGTESFANIFVTEFDVDGDSGINAGSYTYLLFISPSDATMANNYSYLSSYSGSYTVNKRAAQIKWTDTSLTYNAEPQHARISSYGLLSIESNLSEYVTLVYSDTVNAGTYDITADVSSSYLNNYAFTGLTTTYTIAKKDITLKVNDVSTIYDGNTYLAFTYEVTGFIDGDGEFSDVYSVLFTGAGSNAGSYIIKASVTEINNVADNYVVKTVDGTLTVNKKDASLVWENENSYVYDGQAHGPVVTNIIGVVSNEVTDLLSKISYNNMEVNVGEYVRIANVDALTNYNITNLSCDYEITPVTVLLVWDTSSNNYSETNHPMVINATGVINDELDEFLNSLTYNVQPGSNPNEFVVTVSSDNQNYVIDSSTSSYIYTIVEGEE